MMHHGVKACINASRPYLLTLGYVVKGECDITTTVCTFVEQLFMCDIRSLRGCSLDEQYTTKR